MGKKVTLVRMTSERSKRIQSERIYKKKLTKKILKDRTKRLKEFESWRK